MHTLLVYLDVVDVHLRFTVLQGTNLVDVSDSREITSDRQVEEEVELVVEIGPGTSVRTPVRDVQLEIRPCVRVAVLVDIHDEPLLVPIERVEVEFPVLQGVVPCNALGAHLMSAL